MTGRTKVDCCLQDGMRMQGLHPGTQRRLLTWHAVAWTYENQTYDKDSISPTLAGELGRSGVGGRVGSIADVMIGGMKGIANSGFSYRKLFSCCR
jgi:hypothetical protein